MSVLDNLITDRTMADVARAKALLTLGLSGRTAAEEDEYTNGLKGVYNYEDLNRVNDAMTYCVSLLTAAGISVTLSGIKNDWTMLGKPTQAQMTQYLANVIALRAAINEPDTLPTAPTDTKLSYADANNIERILQGVEIELGRIAVALYRCGQSGLYCGGFTLPMGGD